MDLGSFSVSREPSGGDTDTLSLRNRLVLLHHTDLSAVETFSLQDEDINYQLFVTKNVSAKHILAARLGPCWLKSRGVDSALKMKVLGFDSFHLASTPAFCNQMILCFGVAAIVDCFLDTPQDAVNLAGGHTTTMLKLTGRQLLEKCIGEPSHAHAVLKQLDNTTALEGCPASLLLDSGLRLNTLGSCGHTIDSILRQTQATPEQMGKLGFSI